VNSGRCHCQSVKFSFKTNENSFSFICHCNDCNKINGGGHLTALTVKLEDFSSSGKLSIYSYPGGSGENINSHFCPKCGTPIYASLKAHPEVIVLRANAIDDSSDFKPQKSLYPEQAHSWDITTIIQK